MGTKLLNTFFLLLGVFLFATFLNFSSNPPNGRTGAPLEGGGNESTCMACHNPANPAFSGNIAITGLPATIDPSTTYPITVTITATAGSPSRGGFQLVALNSSFQNIGTLTESSPNLGTETSGGRTYMEHRNAINFTGNTVVYSFNWQSPAAPNGEVITMYAAGNIANGSGTANDLIVFTTQAGTLTAAGDPLAVSITASTNITCFGGNNGTATATATGGTGAYSFAWSGGQSGMMATGLSPGMATVTVTDMGSGAMETDAIMITQPSDINLNITSQSTITCVNPAGIATVAASGGTPGYSFLWDNGESNATATNLSVGQHFVTVTDANNCPKTTSVTILQDITPPIANAGSDAAITCNNPTTVLDGSSSSLGGNFTYLWTTADGNIQSGATTTVVTVNAAGTYQLLVTNTTNGCTATDQAVVTSNMDSPTANAGTDVAICQGDNTTLMASATGGSGGYTFAWNNGLGAGASKTVSPAITTTYTVTATDSNGCTDTDQVTVTVNPLPTVNISGDTEFCQGFSAALDAGGGFSSYNWDSGQNTQTITVTAAGTYCVTATDANGCTGEDCIDVVENPLPTVSITGELSFCEGESTELSASSGFSAYLWSTGAATQDITVIVAGQYIVTVTDANGCQNSATVTVTEDATPVLNISGETSICEGNSTTLDAGAGFSSYSWSTGAITQIIAVTSTATYCVTVTDANGCSAEDCIDVTVSAIPTLSITSIDCAADLLTYMVTLSTNANQVTSTAGMVTDNGGGNFTISNIPSGTNISIVATNTATTCATDMGLNAPDCDCPFIAAPTSGGDMMACEGDGIPALTATAPSGMVVDWYDAAMGGNLLLSASTSFTPAGAGTFFAESRDPATNCTSDTRTAISLTINANPNINITAVDCAANLLTYQVILNTDANQVTSSVGMVTNTGGGVFIINNIPSGTNVIITATNTTTNCATEMNVNAPNCECPVIAVPTSGGDMMACEGDGIPALTATAPNGAVVDWYDAAMGGNLLLSASTSFTPAGAGTFFVESRDPVSNCISDTRTAISLTINTNPIINITAVDCAADLLTYQVILNTGANQVTSSAGMVTNTGGGVFIINNIPSGTNVTITATNATTNCTTNTNVNAPNCDCPNIDAPSSMTPNMSICEGDALPSFMATAPNGMVVDWYDAATGGNLLLSASTSFTPAGAGTFFAGSRDPDTGCTSATRTTFSLTVNPLPIATITGASEICEGTTTILEANAGFSSYLWNTGENTQSIVVSEGGEYCVTLTDNNGCVGVTCVTVSTLPLPTITITGDLFFCEGECTTISWGANADEMMEICEPGTYTVSVTDENGCEASTSFDVIENQNPVADAGDDMMLSCVEAAVTIGGNSSTGANITYAWSNGATTATQDVMMAGTYTLTVIDTETGCSSTDEVIVAENTDLPIVDAGAGFEMPCDGPAPILNGMVTPNNNITIEWTTMDGNITSGGNTLMPSIDSPGTYVLTATNNETGCTASAEVVISPATLPVISVDAIIHVACNGESTGSTTVSASGSTAPYTYLWDDMMATTTPMLSNIPAGEYTVMVTDANGCTSSMGITITQPSPIIVTLTATAESANGANDGSISSMVSGGTPGYTYLWSNGSTESTINDLPPGTYTLTVTDANGCTATASAQINTFGCEDMTITVSGNFLLCPGDSDGSISIDVITGGSAPYAILWSTGSDESEITGLGIGNYVATLTDANNCVLISNFDIIEGDTIAPILVTQNITIYLDENGVVSFDPAAIDGGSTDNCGIGEFYVDNTSFDCSHIGENTVQVAVFDTGTLCDAGSAIVTVLDTFPPVFTLCPADIFTLNCSGVMYEMPAASDNCGDLIMELTEGLASGEMFPVGVTTVTYQATDASGNIATCSFDVTLSFELSVVLTATSEINMDSDGSILAVVTGAALPLTFEWTNAAGDIVSTAQDLIGFPADDYCLTTTDANGCSVIMCATIDRIVAVNDAILESHISIAPNPVAHQLYISFAIENDDAATLVVLNMNGQVVFQTQKAKGSDKMQIDVSAYANGVYLLKIIVNEQVAVKRILVNR